jgi:hypothetical protein
MRRQLQTLSLLGCLLGITGCLGPTCDRDTGVVARYSEGVTNEARTFYTTGALDEPFLHFPAGRSYRLEHDLGQLPDVKMAELAFAACPFSKQLGNAGERPRCATIDEDEDTTGIADAAGNEVVYEKVTSTYIEVRNDTCAEFFVRVSAWVFEAEGLSLSEEADGGPLTMPLDAGP